MRQIFSGNLSELLALTDHLSDEALGFQMWDKASNGRNRLEHMWRSKPRGLSQPLSVKESNKSPRETKGFLPRPTISQPAVASRAFFLGCRCPTLFHRPTKRRYP